jgi:hypothetical protein
LNCMPRTGFKHQCGNLEKFIWGRISQARQSSGHTPISEFTFGTYGLVILDADDADLKRPYFCKKRTTTPNSHKAVLETTEKLKVQHTGKPARNQFVLYRR